jgi:hypothetical protein
VSRNASINARDRGVALISRINRWMIAGAVALTGVVSLVASQSFHGHTVSSTSGSSSSSATGSGSSSSAGAGVVSPSNSGGSIQQPAQAPSVPTPAIPSAPVVSGGS